MTDADEDRIRAVCAELRAGELLLALRRAVAAAPHWRWEARCLLERIDQGDRLCASELPLARRGQR